MQTIPLTVLSLNLQNYYGDKNRNTAKAKLGRSQSQVLTRLLALKGQEDNVTVICTQEDEHGLIIPGYREAVSACSSNHWSQKEAVRIYVKREYVAQAALYTVNLKPKHCDSLHIPERCAAVLELAGVRIANVFFPGGRYDDVGMFTAEGECAQELSRLRKQFANDIIKKLRPDIIVGDWNASIYKEEEERIYTLKNDHVAEILKSSSQESDADNQSKLNAWLAWRHSPFPILKKSGFVELWPKVRTTSRVELAVDGFFYRKSRVIPTGPLKVDETLLHDTDHASLVASFERKSSGGHSRRELNESYAFRTLEELEDVHDVTPQPGAGQVGKFIFRAATRAFTPKDVVDTRHLKPDEYEREAATHIYRTFYHVDKSPLTAFISFSTTLTSALNYARNHAGFNFIWIVCVDPALEVRDASTRRGSLRLSEPLKHYQPDDEISYDSGSVPVKWARWKNFLSGLNFNQLVVGRKSLAEASVTTIAADADSFPLAAETILEDQIYLVDRETTAILSEKKFYTNELKLRELLIPNYRTLHLKCTSARPFDRLADDFSEDEIEDYSDRDAEFERFYRDLDEELKNKYSKQEWRHHFFS